MTHRVTRRRDGADRPLAATFRRNAAGFHEAAEAALPRHPEATRYFLAIAIELALKAHLLHRGIRDDWNRIHLRHDLSKALRFARRAGFNGAPAALPELAALLGPYYQVHAISQMPPEAIASVCWSQACSTVRDLIDAVVEAAGFDASDHEGAA
uniref:HEPN domain-containing protein n=1 Tax=Caulobacter sp. (strain K31) TaxID=366602 RepID=B0SXV2_CAUSK